MRIAVVGAGGVGGYVGARLAAAGEDVHLVARGPHLDAIRQRGLRVDSIHGDVVVDVDASDDAASMGPSDVVLFCVKSFDTDAAARAHLPHLVGDETVVISLQNGIDNEQRLAAVVGRSHVAGGLALIFAGVSSPGVITHSGGPARLEFGELDGSDSARLRRFHERCVAAGIDAELSDDIHASLWHKYAFICAVAGTTAAIRLPLGDVRSTPASRRLLQELLEEAYAVAQADGVTVPSTAVEERLRFVDQLEAGMYSSLHDDLVNGRRMELEGLHGTLVRIAAGYGIEVPATRTIHAVLAPWAARNASLIDGA
ncbi:MAG: ketopantoate reductase family protein [Nitriliruptoraceae bacterium]